MNNYYAHTFKLSNFNAVDFFKLEDILKSRFLLSRNKLRMMGDTSMATSECTSLYNGMDYISLCDLAVDHSNYSSYTEYTMKGLSLLIDHDIEVIKPILIDRSVYLYLTTKDLDMINNRYTDFNDEVQVKDRISLNHLRGYCLSMSTFLSQYDSDYLMYYIRNLYRIIEKYNYVAPIYNLDDGEIIKKF